MNTYKKVEEVIQNRKQTGGVKNLTGYKGVTLDKRSNKFTSRFMVSNDNRSRNKFELHLGSYETAEQAYIARLKFIDSLK